MREIVLDTETTGFSPDAGDRIVEIGCVELVNHVATGRTYQQYVNPEMEMPEAAFQVHGLTTDFLRQHPVFADVADGFLDFIEDARLIIHNAEFDMGFINAELKHLERPVLSMERTIDTVDLARRKFPGAQANLDALCRRFDIDLTDRALHGALKDAHLLARVYLELIGGRQPGLELAAKATAVSTTAPGARRPPRPHAPSPEEEAAHAKFLESLQAPLWNA